MKPVLYLLVRHLVATGITVFAALILWTAAYFLLFIWALIGDEGIGSPLAYPLGLVTVFILALTSCLALFLPATSLAEWLCRRFRWPIISQFFISFGFVSLLVVALGLLSLWQGEQEGALLPFWASTLAVIASLTIPLSLYWWLVQFLPLLKSGTQFLRKRFKKVTPSE